MNVGFKLFCTCGEDISDGAAAETSDRVNVYLSSEPCYKCIGKAYDEGQANGRTIEREFIPDDDKKRIKELENGNRNLGEAVTKLQLELARERALNRERVGKMTDLNVEFYGATGEMIAKITRAVRAADEMFEKSGGSSRHWVRECLLHCLDEEGLKIVEINNEDSTYTKKETANLLIKLIEELEEKLGQPLQLKMYNELLKRQQANDLQKQKL
jgi:hypothetical protein